MLRLLAAFWLMGRAAAASCDDAECWDDDSVEPFDCATRPEPLQLLRHDDEDNYGLYYLDIVTGTYIMLYDAADQPEHARSGVVHGRVLGARRGAARRSREARPEEASSARVDGTRSREPANHTR